jgi:signal transduction histidine kinase
MRRGASVPEQQPEMRTTKLMRLCTALQVLCTGLVVWAAGALPASSATRNVVLLFDERIDLPGLAALDADLVGTLVSNSSDRIEVYREAMDLSRFGSNAYKTLLRDFLRAKYADKKIDVVVAALAPALDFLLSNGDAIFPGTPIVFCGVDRREIGDRSLPSHVRGILVKREFAPTLEIALGLHPQTKRVAVVAGTSEFDRQLLDQARTEFRVYEDRVAFTYLSALPLQQTLTELSQLPPQTLVLFTSFFQDGAGAAFVPHDVAQRVSAAARAPVYGFLDQFVGRGIVGGSVYSLSAHGVEAAKLVLRILADPDPSGPPASEVQTNKVLFDWRQMQRWGISESSLPPGSEIRFRDLTTWDQYRQSILATAAVLLLQTALISWLLYERGKRQHLEAEGRKLSGRLIHAHEEERARLARELHDDVTQRLAALAIDAGRGERYSGPAGGAMRSMREGLVRLSEDVHALSYRLHPSILADLGLIEALKAECERFSQCPVRLEANTRDIPEALPQDVGLCLFRIAQEALRNVARHAGARQTEVCLRRLDGGLELTVKDDGAGFDPRQRRAEMSLGHAGMRQRVALLGGNIDIESSPGQGTTILAWVPLTEPSDLSG